MPFLGRKCVFLQSETDESEDYETTTATDNQKPAHHKHPDVFGQLCIAGLWHRPQQPPGPTLLHGLGLPAPPVLHLYVLASGR